MAKLIKRSGSDDTTSVNIGIQAESRPSAIIDRDTFEARTEAQNIRERAQAQADEIIQQAQKQADELLEAARQEAQTRQEQAHAEGLKQGHEQGVTQLSEQVARASLHAEQLEQALVPQLTTLAVQIAQRILGKELEFHPEAIVGIVKHALSDKARQRREISLRIHPDDADIIREHKAELLEMLSRCKAIAIQEDPEVGRHGVIIETEAGTIDAQLDTQLAAFARAFDMVESET